MVVEDDQSDIPSQPRPEGELLVHLRRIRRTVRFSSLRNGLHGIDPDDQDTFHLALLIGGQRELVCRRTEDRSGSFRKPAGNAAVPGILAHGHRRVRAGLHLLTDGKARHGELSAGCDAGEQRCRDDQDLGCACEAWPWLRVIHA